MSESHLLATLLRSRNIPVRIRAGYFRDVYTNRNHLIAFWEKNARAKGIAKQLLDEDPQKWIEVNHEYTRNQVAVNKYVEHWIVEYWDNSTKAWILLDANNVFLEAMSDIHVDFQLPRSHFEHAYEAWQKMRTSKGFNPDQYSETPQDGCSHIRSQLLWDFYSLLNHEIAGYDKDAWGDNITLTSEQSTYAFVKQTNYEDVQLEELFELDSLAILLSQDPLIDELIEFYLSCKQLRIPSLEGDPYCFVVQR